MAREHAQALLDKLERSRDWPGQKIRKMMADLYLYAALREADVDYLRPEDWPADKDFILDPLGQRIPEVWSDMVYGEEPTVTHTAQKQYDFLVEENDLPGEWQTAEGTCSSEGEVWWRCYVDEDLSNAPILDFHSRTTVYPYFLGRKLVAVAFISVIQEGNRAWRYVECHAETIVLNKLYEVPVSQPAGDETTRPSLSQTGRQFGDEVPLTARPEVEEVQPVWDHGLEHMLCGRIINKRGRDRKLGVSDYRGVVGYLAALTDTANTGHDNFKLTARKRVTIDQSVLQPQTVTMSNGTQLQLPIPTFDTRESVFVRAQLDETLGSDSTPPFQVLEYDFDAEGAEVYINGVENRILTRSRIAPQLVGKATQDAATGPALRARLLDSILCANGKGRFWDDENPDMLHATALVDNLPRARGGFGRPYDAIDKLPEVKRADPLPPDEVLELQNDVAEVNAELISRKTVIQRRHPDWDEPRVQQELDEIEKEHPAPIVPDPTLPIGDPAAANGAGGANV